MAISQANGYHVALELSAARVRPILESMIPDPIDTMVRGLPVRIASITGRELNVSILAGNLYTIMAVKRVTVLGSSFNVRITINASVTINALGNFVITFPSVPVIVADSATDRTRIEALAAVAAAFTGDATITADSLLAAAAANLTGMLGAVSLPRIPIGVSLGMHPCSPVTREVTLHTISGSTFLLIQFSGAGLPTPATNPSGFTTSLRGGNDSVVLIANESLLAMATCFATQEPASPLFGSAFTASGACRSLVGSRAVPGTPVTITSLSICVVGSEVVLSGTVTASGTGWNASGSFRAPIGFDCRDDGTIFPLFDTSRISTSINVGFEWWVYLIGFGIAAVLGIILGPLVALILSIVTALLAPIVAALINALVRAALPGVISGVEAAVASGYSMLPPEIIRLLGQIRCERVLLDDLALRGVLGNQVLPSASLVKRESYTPVRELASGTDPITGDYTEYEVTNTLNFQANAYRFKGTLTREWKINGSTVSGSGNVNINGTSVTYRINGAQLTLETPAGANVKGMVMVKVTDAERQSRFDMRTFDVQGTKRETKSLRIPDRFHHLRELGMRVRFSGFPVPDPDDPCPTPWWFSAQIQQQEFVRSLSKGMKISPKKINKINQF